MKLNRKPLLQMTMALAALALFAFAVPGHASLVIDFSESGSAGTITCLTSGCIGGIVEGSGIPITSMTVSGDTAVPADDGTYTVTDGTLNFKTASPNVIEIFGGIPGLASLPNGTTLLTGTFASFTSTFLTVGSNTYGGITSAIGPDTKNAQLLTDLGYSTTTPFEYFSFEIEGVSTTGSATTFTGISSDITNTAVPEPASLFLMGSGLLALGILLRKKLVRPASAGTAQA
jgi:hypothetical protein